ncbi:MAG TPA: UDP-glucose 4-epimerase GalE [Acidimicrobiales bacterium]|nr:UDP-glucose 4-epimerase GalE [Acidimicrobiales bacterium]
MKLLVTGGAGYIGSVVATRLLEEGHTVTVLDDLSTGHRDAVPEGAAFVQARVHQAAQILGASEDMSGFNGAVHLAAASLVGESVANPAKYQENNVVGSTLLVDALVAAGVPRIVFSSTAAVYGDPDKTPIDEDAPTKPVNPYGESKLAIDRALHERCAGGSLAAVSLRYFNVAGAYAGKGERHTTETHLIPIALDVALGRRPQLAVYGEDYPTADGTCIRDYIHVADIADAHLLALQKCQPGRHDIYNLGNGNGSSVMEVIGAVEEVTGRKLALSKEARRAGDPAVLVASAERAMEHLGWQPARPALHQMIGDAWQLVAAN